MQDNTSWTPSPEENLLNLTNKDAINEQEAKGIALAELYLFGLDIETPISTTLLLNIHKTAFGHLYEWAGKWRNTNIIVGQLGMPVLCALCVHSHSSVQQRQWQNRKNINELGSPEVWIQATGAVSS